MEALDASEGRGSLLAFMAPKPISKALPAGNSLEVSMRGVPVFFGFVFNSWLLKFFKIFFFTLGVWSREGLAEFWVVAWRLLCSLFVGF